MIHKFVRDETRRSYEYWLGQLHNFPNDQWISGQVHAYRETLHILKCVDEDISSYQDKYECPCHVCIASRKRKETNNV